MESTHVKVAKVSSNELSKIKRRLSVTGGVNAGSELEIEKSVQLADFKSVY